MKPLGISRNQLARDIDVPVGRISDITNGKRGITADTALRLAHYLGTDAELWMGLQAEYDLHVARMTTWPAIEPRVRVRAAPPTVRSVPPARVEDRSRHVAPPSAETEPATTPFPAPDRFAGLERKITETSTASDEVRPVPFRPSHHGEPYHLTNPLDDSAAVEEDGDDLVIPPLPKE